MNAAQQDSSSAPRPHRREAESPRASAFAAKVGLERTVDLRASNRMVESRPHDRNLARSRDSISTHAFGLDRVIARQLAANSRVESDARGLAPRRPEIGNRRADPIHFQHRKRALSRAKFATDESMSKRPYTRRTEEEKILELEAKIQELKQRAEMKSRKDGPVLRELRKVKKTLTRFVQTSYSCERVDLATMTEAFLAGLERSAGAVGAIEKRRGGRGAKNDDE